MFIGESSGVVETEDEEPFRAIGIGDVSLSGLSIRSGPRLVSGSEAADV